MRRRSPVRTWSSDMEVGIFLLLCCTMVAGIFLVRRSVMRRMGERFKDEAN